MVGALVGFGLTSRLLGLYALASHWVHTRHGRTFDSLPAAAAEGEGNILRARVLCFVIDDFE
jgi:hypothetical protein